MHVPTFQLHVAEIALFLPFCSINIFPSGVNMAA